MSADVWSDERIDDVEAAFGLEGKTASAIAKTT